ncbi:hypothetical protein [Granulicella sp. 5B5]|uniref:hypothetical protein n=1 Tax=Granulicella sp. 5B5 TaxID=1617967 RepID=UPI0015F53FDB|nr:hypothetical protein [Granulicella sp. 5B5]
MKIRSVKAQLFAGLILAASTLVLGACRKPLYYYPQYNYAGRPTPPSGLLFRVLAAYNAGGLGGGLEILDGQNDLRGNIQNTITHYSISGYSETDPLTIINYPEQLTGYAYSLNDGALTTISYSKETSSGTAASFGANAPSAAATPTGIIFAGAAEQAGQLIMSTGGTTYAFSLPNVDKVVVNPGATVVLAMVHNSNTLYRIVKLPATTTPVLPPGYVDCEPLLLPTYCVVPVAGTYDRPSNAYFSLDGNTAYVMNCGPECGGTTASVSFLSLAALQYTNVPTVNPLSASAPSPLQTLPVANPVPIPGGVTTALADSNYLYLAGQQLQGNGLFAGNLTLLNLATDKIDHTYSISDGTHTRMIFGDYNTLWIGSSQCANGVRAALAAAGGTTQAANTNCLTRFTIGSTLASGSNAVLPSWAANTAYTVGQQITDGTNIEVVQTAGTSGGSAPSWQAANDATTKDSGVTWVNIGAVSPVQIIPAITPNSTLLAVQYPNTNQNQNYYGSLTGICWVQSQFKMYTAYGGQIHVFNTIDGSERNNINVTVQGTVNDVAYIDALTNEAN